MNYLPVPDSNLKLYEGSIVELERFTDVKWILHNGWYTYNDTTYMGWYFESIPAQTQLPVSPDDLRGITLISGKSDDACPDNAIPHCHHHDVPGGLFPPVPPKPEPEKPAFFSKKLKIQLEEAFITVPSIAKRDELVAEQSIPDGKIVRVNNVEGEPKYYIWDGYNEHWNDFELTTKEDVDAVVAQAISDADIPGQVAQAVAEDPTIIHYDQVVELIAQAIADADIPGLVAQAIAEDPTIAHKSDIPAWAVKPDA